MSSLVRSSGNAEQLYINVEIMDLLVVLRQILSWDKIVYKTDIVKAILFISVQVVFQSPSIFGCEVSCEQIVLI